MRIHNINTSDDTKTAIMRLTSNMKDANGEFLTKDIIIVCLGKNGANGGGGTTPDNPDGPTSENDIYIQSGTYDENSNTITFQRHASTPFSVELTGIEDNITEDFWYFDNR